MHGGGLEDSLSLLVAIEHPLSKIIFLQAIGERDRYRKRRTFYTIIQSYNHRNTQIRKRSINTHNREGHGFRIIVIQGINQCNNNSVVGRIEQGSRKDKSTFIVANNNNIYSFHTYWP